MTRASGMRVLLAEGGNLALRLEEKPLPEVAEDRVRVQVKASGVNPLDLKIRAGAAAHARHPLPAILGIDVAGTVESVGSQVTAFRPGDDVYGMTGGVGGIPGSLAEYVAVDPRLLAHKPKSLDMRQAAALPLALITAWEGLVDRARVSAGQQVLVQGGAGGVGYVTVQLAKARGAQVYATGSAAHQAVIESLGATPIDYQQRTLDDYVAQYTKGEGFDVVYDTVGGRVLDDSFKAVKRFGHVVSALGWGTHALAPLSFKGGTYSGVFTLLPLLTGIGREHHGEILREGKALAERGQLAPRVDPRHFTLETANEAYEALASGKTEGKIVIEVVSEEIANSVL